MVKAYPEKVFRPTYDALVCQLEVGLRAVDNKVQQSYSNKASWHGWRADNQCPEARQFMVGWMLSQVYKTREFLEVRGWTTQPSKALEERSSSSLLMVSPFHEQSP